MHELIEYPQHCLVCRKCHVDCRKMVFNHQARGRARCYCSHKGDKEHASPRRESLEPRVRNEEGKLQEHGN